MGRRLYSGTGVVALALFASQLGHLIAYQLRFGRQAAQIETTGVHAYLPSLMATTGAIAGGVLIGGLLVIALARLLVRSACGARRQASVSFVTLLSVLFTLQLAFFMAQETIESLSSTGELTSPMALVLWGTLGQLPVALLCAVVVRWLTARFETALQAITEAVRRLNVTFGLGATSAAPVARCVDLARLLSQVSGRSGLKRGPPALQLAAD
jgi:hypothetical protein